MEAKLVFPEYRHKDAMKIYVTEFLKEASDIPGMWKYEDCLKDYDQWVKKEKQMHLGIHLDPGLVPGTTYLYIKDHVVIGTINIRHCLNDDLWLQGGHIGYAIHPSYRRQGYATKMLQEALVYCKQWEIWPVLITCRKGNIGSQKTIEKCGGILENEYTDKNTEETSLRFWIGR